MLKEDNVAGKLTNAVKSGINTIKRETARLAYDNDGSVPNAGKSGTKTDFYATADGTIIPANKVKTNSLYDRPEVEVYSGRSMRPKNATDDWDSFLGPNQTDIDPRTGQKSLDRIWSAEGTILDLVITRWAEWEQRIFITIERHGITRCKGFSQDENGYRKCRI